MSQNLAPISEHTIRQILRQKTGIIRTEYKFQSCLENKILKKKKN
jgi:hypothetical protein